MGMLRNVTAPDGGNALNHDAVTNAERRQDIVVIHSAPTGDDVIFGTELRALAAGGQIRLVERHTDTGGKVTMDDVAALVPDWAQRETWACGPTGLLDTAEEHWDATGIADRLHTERFRPTVLATGEGGTVTFSGSAVSVEADGASPLLDVGEDAGLIMPSGCRMGICFGCVLPLREGAVRDLRNGEVTTAEPENPVLIQTCVSAAAGTCDIDLSDIDL
jgi:stearoyl-CoA 9-desaturase NADPH oxidoreductase